MTKSSRVWGTGGRWAGHSSGAYFRTDDRLALGLYSYDTYFLPRRIRNLRLDTFRVTYKVGRYTALGNPYWAEFNFNIKDEDEHLGIWVKHTTGGAAAPGLKQFVDGGEYTSLSVTQDAGEAVSLTNWSDPLWVRVVVDPDDGQSEYVKVYESTTEGGLDSANECLIYSGAVTLDGGQLGFGAGFGLTVDEIKIEVPDGQGGWDTEFEEEFTVDANNRTENDSLAHDAARNLTYDGRHKFVYDAWNRLVEVKRAYRNATSPYTLNETSSIATLSYDGLGRRISKAVTNSADWNATYHYYYDGYRMIETHNGSGEVIKQHVWGTVYVDELVQIGINDDPGEDDDPQTEGTQDYCETFYYPLQDANFNVLGLAESDGDLNERYEYSPYGQRTIYKSAGPDDPMCSAPILESQPHPDLIGSLCDIGHQGLLHDKEFDLIYNRARYLHPILGRFLQRDRLGYVDGLNLYEYVGSSPVSFADWRGLAATSAVPQRPVRTKGMTEAEYRKLWNEWIAEKRRAGLIKTKPPPPKLPPKRDVTRLGKAEREQRTRDFNDCRKIYDNIKKLSHQIVVFMGNDRAGFEARFHFTMKALKKCAKSERLLEALSELELSGRFIDNSNKIYQINNDGIMDVGKGRFDRNSRAEKPSGGATKRPYGLDSRGHYALALTFMHEAVHGIHGIYYATPPAPGRTRDANSRHAWRGGRSWKSWEEGVWKTDMDMKCLDREMAKTPDTFMESALDQYFTSCCKCNTFGPRNKNTDAKMFHTMKDCEAFMDRHRGIAERAAMMIKTWKK